MTDGRAIDPVLSAALTPLFTRLHIAELSEDAKESAIKLGGTNREPTLAEYVAVMVVGPVLVATAHQISSVSCPTLASPKLRVMRLNVLVFGHVTLVTVIVGE